MASIDSEPGLLVQRLSQTELEILRGTVAGESLTSITARLGLSEASADACWESLMKKLGARTTADAVRIGITTEAEL